MSARKPMLPCGCLSQDMHDLMPGVEAVLHASGVSDTEIGNLLRHNEDVDGTPAGIARRRETHPNALAQVRAKLVKHRPRKVYDDYDDDDGPDRL